MGLDWQPEHGAAVAIQGMHTEQSFVLVVVGLAFEARILRNRRNIAVHCRRRAEASAVTEHRLSSAACRGVISFGIAGGLDPRFPSGSHVVASEILTPTGIVPTDLLWSTRLMAAGDHPYHARILGRDRVVVDPDEKQELFQATGAIAVDTESHTVAVAAQKHNLPFVCFRVIADAAQRRIPDAALSGLHPDGRSNPLGTVRTLMRRPHELPALILLARDAWVARRCLLRALTFMGDDLGLSTSDGVPPRSTKFEGDDLIVSTA